MGECCGARWDAVRGAIDVGVYGDPKTAVLRHGVTGNVDDDQRRRRQPTELDGVDATVH